MNNILNSYFHIEPKLYNFLFNNSWQLCCLLILVYIFLGFKYKSKPLFTYYLYSLILIKMIFPIFILIPTIKTNIPEVIINAVQIIPNNSLITENNFGFSYQTILLLFWFIGVLCGFCYLILNFIKLSRVASRSSCFNSSIIPNLLQKLNLNNKVIIKTSSEITTPLVFGIIKFTILLPNNIVNWTCKELELVLCHELAHIKRKDTYAILIQNFIKIIYFYHPLVWIISKKITIQREQLCDYKTIALLGISKNIYVKTLYNSINNLFTTNNNYILVNNLSHSGIALKERFNFLIKLKEKKLKLRIIEKLFVGFILMTTIVLSINYSNKISEVKNNIDFFEAYIKPTVVGGNQGVYSHLTYPKKAKEQAMGGKVLLKFICNKNGEIENLEVLKEKPSGYGFGEASKQAIKQVVFTPGKDKNGNPIRVTLKWPLFFKIK